MVRVIFNYGNTDVLPFRSYLMLTSITRIAPPVKMKLNKIKLSV